VLYSLTIFIANWRITSIGTIDSKSKSNIFCLHNFEINNLSCLAVLFFFLCLLILGSIWLVFFIATVGNTGDDHYDRRGGELRSFI